MAKRILLYLLFIAPALLSSQTVDFNTNMRASMKSIIRLRYNELHQRLEQERKQNPDNVAADYLEGASIGIGLFIRESEEDFEKKLPRLEELIERIEKLSDKEPYRKLMLGEINLAIALLHAKFQNNFSAAWQFYRAYNYLDNNYKEFPDFMPNYVPLGVLYAGIGSLPDDYRSMASLLGFHGDVDEGMEMVKKGYWTTVSDPEVAFYREYFGFIYSYVFSELKPGSSVSPVELGLDVTSSGFLIYLQARIYMLDGEVGKAVEILKKVPRGKDYLSFNYLNYQTGKIAITTDMELARESFERFLRNTKSPNYLRSTYRYLTWYYLLKGEQDKAAEMKEKIFKEGGLFLGADKQALREAKRGFNVTLIKARLLFDGGQFKETLNLLNKNPIDQCCKTSHERVEYYYRKGRAYQELGQVKEAVVELDKALAYNKVEACYALGNSALQAAFIYEQSGKPNKAKEYFKLSLKYKDYPFYEGIHQKAKAGLNRVK